MSILEGYVIGLGMVIFIGPVFFLLLNSSLQSGVKAGVAVALGIIVSDIICVALCYYGLSSIINIEKNSILDRSYRKYYYSHFRDKLFAEESRNFVRDDG